MDLEYESAQLTPISCEATNQMSERDFRDFDWSISDDEE